MTVRLYKAFASLRFLDLTEIKSKEIWQHLHYLGLIDSGLMLLI